MFLSIIFHLETFLRGEFDQSLVILITFIILYKIIFYLLATAENKKYFQENI